MTFTKTTVGYLAILVLLLYAGAVYTFASPPGSPYTVADNITDPSCAPNALNCYVNSVLADNGLVVSGSTVQLGGSLTQNTTIDQNGFNFIISQPVLSLGGTVVTAQGPALINSFPGTISGYLVPNGDVARHITWVNPSGAIATLSGSGDPTFVRGGAEMTTFYNPTDTASAELVLHAYDTPNGNGTRIVLDPDHIDFQFSGNAEFRIGGDAGSSGYVLTSHGSGSAPVWQVTPIAINGTTIYSAGFSSTGSGGLQNIFLGDYSGNGSSATNSVFLGQNAGQGATSASTANFLGLNAGQNASGSWGANFLGENAGYGATAAYLSNFLGRFAGQGATAARVSNFIGYGSGYLSTNAQQANFLGWSAGGEAPNASFSNFMGREAGFSADNASSANFLGPYAGRYADNAANSNFFGNRAGHGAINAANANFIGTNAGDGATNARNSIFIGYSAGSGDSVNNTASSEDFSILIGKATSTGGFSNSIAIGGSATNTASNQFMIGSSTRPIDTLVLTGSGGNTCVLDVTVASPSCSSDETLKTNITDLSTSTLEKLLNVKTVSYNWKNYPDKGSQIGFLAQDLEQYFPEVVSTAPNAFKTVSYGGMTPILVEAVRELNMKVNALALGQSPVTVFDGIKNWLGDAHNGLENLFVKKVTTEELCVRNAQGETCISRDALDKLLQQNVPSSVIPETTPDTVPAAEPIQDVDTSTPAEIAGQ
jgi:hypothetical protein